MSVFGDRLRQLREEQGLTTEQLASKLGIGRTTLTNYETGTRRPKQETMDAILDFFNVDLAWLDGKTEVRNIYNFDGIYKAGYEDGLKEANPFTEEEQEMIHKFRNLKESDQELISAMLDRLQPEEIEDDYECRPAYRTLDLFGVRPSAGTGNYLVDGMSKSEIQVIENPISKKADFALVVDGRSMEPKFHDGDTVLIQKTDSVDPGEYGVFSVNNEAVVKQCFPNRLHSLNPDYDDIYLSETDEVHCFGKVIGTL